MRNFCGKFSNGKFALKFGQFHFGKMLCAAARNTALWLQTTLPNETKKGKRCVNWNEFFHTKVLHFDNAFEFLA